jgi:hypothetical protein
MCTDVKEEGVACLACSKYQKSYAVLASTVPNITAVRQSFGGLARASAGNNSVKSTRIQNTTYCVSKKKNGMPDVERLVFGRRNIGLDLISDIAVGT